MSCLVRSSSRACLLKQRHQYASTFRVLAHTKLLVRSNPWRNTTPASLRFHGTHGHHHGHGHGDHGHVHADLVTTLQSSSKKGMRITWIGLAANVGLTASKGIAGWAMNSASLLADAAHSMSDLLSDFVTLYTFKMSRKPPDDIYPYGYGKFETLGSVAVSTFLLAGGAAIAYHSLDLLLAAINVSSTTAQETAASTASVFSHSHGHGHAHGAILDPNAAWFALLSVIVKEWLYRATIKVGISERSDVLVANAWHHRSDAFSSGVALVAIVGSYAGIPVLDPLGGIAVAAMIMKSGGDILLSALRELMDKGISRAEVDQVAQAVATLKKKEKDLLSFHSIRGRKQGPFQHVDLVVQVDPALPMHRAFRLERSIQDVVKKECPQVQQVLVSLNPIHNKSNK